jgi:hypothetical protein
VTIAIAIQGTDWAVLGFDGLYNGSLPGEEFHETKIERPAPDLWVGWAGAHIDGSALADLPCEHLRQPLVPQQRARLVYGAVEDIHRVFKEPTPPVMLMLTVHPRTKRPTIVRATRESPGGEVRIDLARPGQHLTVVGEESAWTVTPRTWQEGQQMAIRWLFETMRFRLPTRLADFPLETVTLRPDGTVQRRVVRSEAEVRQRWPQIPLTVSEKQGAMEAQSRRLMAVLQEWVPLQGRSIVERALAGWVTAMHEVSTAVTTPEVQLAVRVRQEATKEINEASRMMAEATAKIATLEVENARLRESAQEVNHA